MPRIIYALALSSIAIACSPIGPIIASNKAPSAAARPSPVPAADVVNTGTCQSITWLLTHYEVERLASGSSPGEDRGYPQACCSEEALGPEASQCQLDWPSSDLVDCSLWQDFLDALVDAYPEAPRPQRVEGNMVTLKRWNLERHQCSVAK